MCLNPTPRRPNSSSSPMAAGDHLRLGSYLGDGSALSFLPSPPRSLLLLSALSPSPPSFLCISTCSSAAPSPRLCVLMWAYPRLRSVECVYVSARGGGRVCLLQLVGDDINGLRRLVAAGTGSELLVYDVDAARLVASFQVFDGVRLHGIQPRGTPNCANDSPPAELTVAVFGERRVKLFRLRLDAEGGSSVRLELE